MSRHVAVAGDAQTARLVDLVTWLGTELAIEPRIEYLDPQPGDVAITFADGSKAEKHIGYSPRIGIREGLRRFVAWYRSGQR